MYKRREDLEIEDIEKVYHDEDLNKYKKVTNEKEVVIQVMNWNFKTNTWKVGVN